MKKIDGLQGLRAVAFIAIFISHTSVGNYSKLGAWGVSIFLVLSGFVMVYSYWNKRELISLMPKDVIGFAWNKIKKLYPLHIVMMLSCILIALYDVFIIHVLTIRKLIVDVVLHTFLLQIWIPDSTYYMTLNGVSWYLCVCVLLYLVFPFALKILSECDKKNGIRRILIALAGLGFIQLLIAFIAYRYGGQNWNDPWSMQWITYYCPVSRLVDFLIGCSVGYLFVRKDDFLLALREMIPDKKGIARFHTSTQVTAIINVFSVVHMMLILYLWHSVIGGGGYLLDMIG